MTLHVGGFTQFIFWVVVSLNCSVIAPTIAFASPINLDGPHFISQFTQTGFIEIVNGRQSKEQIKIFLKKPTTLEVAEQQNKTTASRITIYIEGDGAPWKHRQVAPYDPTPTSPIGAYLALADPNKNIGYLGRPCMYLTTAQLNECPSSLWTNARFGKEALFLANRALDDLLEQRGQLFAREAGPVSLNLVGYSGGGALAALLAAQRTDVACLVTIASPLDIEVWAKLQQVAPLSNSFNPAYPSDRLIQIPQMHWYGAKDRVVPLEAVGRYKNWPQNLDYESVIRVLPNFNHRNSWVRDWPILHSQTCLNEKNDN